MNYVLCSGGLGNQMFQYAFYRLLCDNNIPASFDTSFYKHNSIHNGYELEKCFGIKDGNDSVDHFSFLYKCLYHYMLKRKIHKLLGIKVELANKKIFLEDVKKNDVLYGFWQGSIYFDGQIEKIKEVFRFENLSDETVALAKKIKQERAIAIHVRRGDYCNSKTYIDLSKTGYYTAAINYIDDNIECGRPLYVFSDDSDWCEKSGLFPQNAIYLSSNNGSKAYEDMYLMSEADILIAANSSFSWWAGCLGTHSYVIRPSKYTFNWSKEDDDRLYPRSWIKIEG